MRRGLPLESGIAQQGTDALCGTDLLAAEFGVGVQGVAQGDEQCPVLLDEGRDPLDEVTRDPGYVLHAATPSGLTAAGRT